MKITMQKTQDRVTATDAKSYPHRMTIEAVGTFQEIQALEKKINDALRNTRPNDAKAMIAEGLKAIDRDLLYRAVSDKIAEEHDTKLVTDYVVLDALLAVCENEVGVR